MIFDDKTRTRTEPKKPGEDEFAFYDSAAGPAYDTYRALLSGWMVDYWKPGSSPRDCASTSVARATRSIP